MKSDHFQKIDKTELERVKELYFSLRIIFDSKEYLQKGKFYQISVLYGQLRSLLTERSKGITPLLFKISEILDDELEFYCLPDTFDKDLPDLAKTMTLRISSLSPSIFKTLPKQEKIKMEEFLDENIITFEQQKFKVRKIIEELANKYGGSHYSETTHKYLAQLLSFGFNNQPMLDNIIIQIANLSSELGIQLLKKITDIELYFNLYPTEKLIKEEVFLVDYKLPNNQNRMSIIINQGRWHFVFIDNIGYRTVLSLNKMVEYEKMTLINISCRLTEKFQTEIRIYINEYLEKEIIIEDPQLFINDLHQYDCLYNRNVESSTQDYEYGLGEIAVYGRSLNYSEKLQLFKYFDSKKYESIIWFNNKSFGESKSGNRNIQMNGEVTRKDIHNGA